MFILARSSSRSLLRFAPRAAVAAAVIALYAAPGFAHNDKKPWDASKFRGVLGESKLQYPESGTAIANGDFSGSGGYIHDRFYLHGVTSSSQGNMRFTAVGSGKRCELRVEYSFDVKDSTPNRIVGKVKPITTTTDEYTVMQLHEDRSGAKPCARIAYIEDRKGTLKHMWLIVRGSPNGSVTYKDLGARSGSFKDIYLQTYYNSTTKKSMLKAYYNGKSQYYDVSGYEGANMYWKAGAYNQASGTSRVDYSSLKLER